MALSGYPETTPLQLLLFSLLLLLLAGSAVALPARPAMDRARWQVDRVNRRGPSLGLVMSYVDEATALQASGYFTPWRVLPFVDLYASVFPAPVLVGTTSSKTQASPSQSPLSREKSHHAPWAWSLFHLPMLQ